MMGPDAPVLQIGPARLTRGLDRHDRIDWPTHQRLHGRPKPCYADELIKLSAAGLLCGRGGAAFPFARKLQAVADAAARRNSRTVVVINGTEGEPGSAKDKVLLTRAPHLALDGAELAATALNAREIVVGVTDDRVAASVDLAIAERGLTARVVRLPERFITGESGALIRGINGNRAIPPGRKLRSSESGVGGLPTLLSNAETFAQLALLASLGPEEYRSVGIPREPGTVLLTVSGSARFPAVVEIPTGAPLVHLLDLCGANPGDGVLVGGYHGAWLSREAATAAEVSRESMMEAGGALGAGIIMPIGRRTCPLGECARVAHYLAGESAGQCGPCRVGLPDIAGALSGLAAGHDTSAALAALRRSAQLVRGRGACGHPDGVARFALSAIDAFTSDVADHLTRGTCGRPMLGLLPVGSDGRTAGRLEVDWSRCKGHGLCADILRGLVRMDAYGYPLLPTDPISAQLERDARRAVAQCPSLALRLRRPDSP
ncbi:MAG TPA: NADH-ubiquinone oxidoreductase-F iron-sulfur binding region domain-containing protein [Streptosporangiaceae bacterium]|jgi:NADH:ubiquinone oxidoreductase subunit F (NADH-binding)/ferredoxin